MTVHQYKIKYQDICKRILEAHYIGNDQVVATEVLQPFLEEIAELLKKERAEPPNPNWKDEIGMSEHAQGAMDSMMHNMAIDNQREN
jgi:hypothetical protein